MRNTRSPGSAASKPLILLLVAAFLVAAVVLSACGSDSDDTTSGGAETTAAETGESGGETGAEGAGGDAAAEFAKLQQGSSQEVESAKYGPVKAPASLNLFFISCAQTIPGCLTGVENIEEVAETVGYPVTVCDVPTGTPEEFQKCMSQAISAKPDYIINNSTPPSAAPAAYKQAHDEGIPIVGQFSGFEPDPAAGNTLEAGFMSETLGEAIGVSMVAASESEEPEILQMVDTIYPHSAPFSEGVENAVSEFCPGCTLENIEYQATDLETTAPGLIQTTLQQHRDAEWLFTGAVAFTGVLAANSARGLGLEQFKIAGFNAEPANIALLKKCEFEQLDIAIGTPEISWVVMDLIVRDAAGKPVPGGIENPTYKVLTCEEPNAYPGPPGFEEEFLELWGKS